MSQTALIVGGGGQIGQAVARNLMAHGWRVLTAQRGPSAAPYGVESVALDRNEPGALARAIGAGVDAVIDTVAYDATHAGQLLDIQADVGAFVVVSSASVYRDEAGRTLDEAAGKGFPRFPVPIGEDQPTVAPGPDTYSTRKSALEQTLLQGARRPVAILRPCAIHGPGCTQPREWFFIKRLRDGRRFVPLAWNGESRFHTTATANIAELTRVALEAPETRVLNIADPEAPTVSQIGAAIAGVYGRELVLAPFDGPPVNGVGGHPWAVPRPLIVDTRRAEAIGYRPVARYEDDLDKTCRSIEALADAGAVFPEYIRKLFDYAAEDAFLAARPSPSHAP